MSKTLRVIGVLSGAAVAGVAATAPSAGASVNITWKSTQYGKYLGIYQGGTSNGNWANIYAWENAANQKWSALVEGYDVNGDTEWAFVNLNSGKCLEDYAYETSGRVDQWDCGSYGANTRWEEAPVQSAYGLYNYGSGEFACPTSGDWVVWSVAECLWK